MIVLVGYYIVNTMTYTIETTPDIPDIGGPPRSDLMMLMVCGMIIPIYIILKLYPNVHNCFFALKTSKK